MNIYSRQPESAKGSGGPGPPGAEGVYVAVTHSGVTLAAYLARLITAELITGAAPAALAPYRPGRFTAAAGQ
jgi:glycine/D-amino acid oxidase-like deaminating enzyme